MILETVIATHGSISRFVCVMKAQSVLCEVGTEVTNGGSIRSV